MSLAYVDSGGNSSTSTSSTTGRTRAYPAVTTSGNLLVLACLLKSGTNTLTTPPGWTAIVDVSGGYGTDGVENSGTVRLYTWYKISDGTEGGTSTDTGYLVSTTAGEILYGEIFQFSKTSDEWDIAAASGAQNSVNASWSVTMGSDPGLTAGDLVIVVSGHNSNTGTWSSQALVASGATFGGATEIVDSGSLNGTNARFVVVTAPVTAGTSSAAATYTATISATAGDYPAGASLLIRLRETTSGPTLTDVDTDETIVPGQTGVVATGTNLSDGASARWVDANANVLTMTNYSASATAPTFDVPSLATTLAAGVKFGSGDFEIWSA